MSQIQRVGIVGCGVMGAGIAEVAARAGLDVRVFAAREVSIVSGRKRLLRSLDHGVRKGRITAGERDHAVNGIQFSMDVADLADRQIIIEAIPEHEPMKIDMFGTLDKVAEVPDVILASTTSSIPIIRLARATTRPGQVIGTHFFNPAPTLELVELTASFLTASDVYEDARSFIADTLGKVVIKAPDRAGFVVNALLVPYLLSAIRMVDSGHVTADMIDKGMTLGCAHPVGPLGLADLVGLDTVLSASQVLYEEFKEPQYSPPPLLLRMVEAGLLGKKSGRGFYRYE
jgi:3-hydroxybutyryl-CoA dehydrogenase